MRLKKTSSYAYWFSAAIALAVFLLQFTGILDFQEDRAIDYRLKLRGAQTPHASVVLVNIDDQSLAALGQWPWPRSIHAVLVELISRYSPKLIFFDILFTEASPNPDEDEKLSQALKNAGNVILSFFYHSEKPFYAFFPIEKLRQPAQGIAYVNVNPERDGIVRKIRAYLDADGTRYYHPAVLAKSLLSDNPENFEKWLSALPTDRKKELWINYPGSFKDFETISFADVIEAAGTEKEAVLFELFKDKIVLIGQTATGTTDISHTPFSSLDPGVVVQGSAFHTIFTGKFLKQLPAPLHLVILLLCSAAAVFIIRRITPVKGILLVAAAGFFYAVFNFFLFVMGGFILPLFTPLIVVAASYFLVVFLQYLEVRFQEEIITRELQTAYRIQENFLPQNLPDSPALNIAYESRFAEQVGGDLYDWVDLGEGKLGVCVGDVSGKGIPAALYMAKALGEFRRENKVHETPGQVCQALNDQLAQAGTSGMFLTLLYAVVDPLKKKIIFSSAGHEPLVLYCAREKKARVMDSSQGIPLGLFEQQPYPNVEIPFEEGDYFLMISDGVRELRNPSGKEMGMDRLKDMLEKGAGKQVSAKEMLEYLFREMNSYQRGARPHDDRTLFCIKFNLPGAV